MTLGQEWIDYWSKTQKYYENLAKGRCEIKPRHWVLLYDSILSKFISEKRNITLQDLYTLKMSSGFIAFNMKRNMSVSDNR